MATEPVALHVKNHGPFRETYFFQNVTGKHPRSPRLTPPFFVQIAPKAFGAGMVPSDGDTLGCTLGTRCAPAITLAGGPRSSENLDPPYSVFVRFVVQIACGKFPFDERRREKKCNIP